MEDDEKSDSKKRMKISGIPNLPDDLIEYILDLLPARSLCRFRCVSKPWLSILTDEEFISERQDISRFELEVQDDHVIHYTHVGSIDGKPDIDPKTTPEIRMVNQKDKGVSSELIAYRFCENFICYRCDNKHLYLMDNLSKKSYLLPPLPLSFVDFDFEFGFDPQSNQFKVLTWGEDANSSSNFHILTLKTSHTSNIPVVSNWRPIDSEVPVFKTCKRSFVTSNGVCYLFDGTVLLSFHLGSQQFRIVHLPFAIHNDHDSIQHPSLVLDEFPNEFQEEGYLYDQENAFKVYEVPKSVYNAYCTKPMVQFDFDYSMFQYEDSLAFAETSSFESTVGFMQSSISGIWLFNEDKATWSKIMGKTTPPVRGVPASNSWRKKHAKLISTRRGEIVLTASRDDRHFMMVYDFFDRCFRTKCAYTQSTSGNATCKEIP